MDNIVLLNHLVLGFAVAILVGEIYALRLISQLRDRLDGKDGKGLLTLMLRFGVGVTLAQLLTIVNAWLRFSDPTGSSDLRLVLFASTQIIYAVLLGWVLREVSRIPVE